MPKIISLFTGCGGLDYGFNKYFDIIEVCEDDFDSLRTYNLNFRTFFMTSDIRDRSFLKNQNSFIIGGPPCQDFTMVQSENRKGVSGKQGILIYEFLRCLKENRADGFLFENVPGFKSLSGGIFASFLKELRELNYFIIWQIVNFAEFGVPQKRKRLFIFGHKLRKGFIFPEGDCDEARYVSSSIALKEIPDVNNEKLKIRELTRRRISSIPPGGNNSDAPISLQIRQYRDYTYRRLHPDKPSKTIIGRGGGGSLEYHFSEPRPLTNRERARLQSFPDDFVFIGDYGSIRSQICNAVPPKYSEIIARKILKCIKK